MKVVVGLSGGVDSAVSAWLLKEQGYSVIGVFMKNWEDDDTDEYCASQQDLLDAVAVAERVGIEIEVVNFSQAYKERVFAHFLSEYQAGRTPNPDVACNAEIKFKAFLEYALTLGASHIATGHYAKVRENPLCAGQFQLLKAEDSSKDQSYFLYRLTQQQLAHTLFPLGEYLKRDVREMARKIGLCNANKKDSTGLCFVGERPFRAFLNRYLPYQEGEICTLEGKVVGVHQGLMFYTLGQRQGLGIGGSRSSTGDPWFVVDKDLPNNRLLVVQGNQHPALWQDGLIAQEVHWISGELPHTHWVYSAKTRYRQPSAACELDERTYDTATVRFGQPQWAITPGQSVVLYESQVCLGGGVIAQKL